MRLVVVRGPEAHYRPERGVVNAVVNAARAHPLEIQVVDLGALDGGFDNLLDQSNFYDSVALTRNMRAILSVAEKLQPYDTVFFSDAWNPSIPTLRYLLACGSNRLLSIPSSAPHFYGVMHSSVNVPGDLLQPHKDVFSDSLERSIMDSLNGVFVATEASKSYLADKDRPWVDAKVHVTGLPFVPSHKCSVTMREPYTVAWPHRWAMDKGVDRLLALAYRIRSVGDGSGTIPDLTDNRRRICREVTFRVLHPVPIAEDAPLYREAVGAGIEFRLCPTRQDYLDQLGRASVVLSTAQLETFGYAMLEGWELGCFPLVPELPAYRYVWASSCFYDYWNLANRLLDVLERPPIRKADGRFSSLRESMRRTAFLAADKIVSIMVEAYEDEYSGEQ